MLQLLEIYLLTIVAGVLAAVALALWGAQVAARDKSMQTLCIGQGAMLGVLVGIGLLTVSGASGLAALPFGLAIAVSLAVGRLGLWIDGGKLANPTTWFSALFAGLLAMNYLVSAVFPSLESYMAQVFFGDLATLSESQAWLTLGASLAGIALQLLSWQESSNRSFEQAIFGGELNHLHTNKQKLVDGLLFIYVCFAIQFLGFLFTIALLFIPTIVVSLAGWPGLRRHLMLAAIVGASSTLVGFVTSLYFSRLPTVPTIVSFALILGLVLMLVSKLARNKN